MEENGHLIDYWNYITFVAKLVISKKENGEDVSLSISCLEENIEIEEFLFKKRKWWKIVFIN